MVTAMNAPHDLTPASVAWIHTQIALANARTAAPIRAELEQIDNWANGIFLALQDALLCQVKSSPAMAHELARDWSRVADRFDAIEAGVIPAEDGETLELLEARKMLYRLFALLKLWPHQSGAITPNLPPRRAA